MSSATWVSLAASWVRRDSTAWDIVASWPLRVASKLLIEFWMSVLDGCLPVMAAVRVRERGEGGGARAMAGSCRWL